MFVPLRATFNRAQSIWNFPNGATLRLWHLWDEQDAETVQGYNFSWMCFEEAGAWPTPAPLNRARAALRSAAGVPVEFLLTANPGGPGNGWLRSRYVDPAPLWYKVLTDPKTGQQRVFIPSVLEDNKILMQSAPDYERRLLDVGSPALVQAWRYGRWDVQLGGFFDD